MRRHQLPLRELVSIAQHMHLHPLRMSCILYSSACTECAKPPRVYYLIGQSVLVTGETVVLCCFAGELPQGESTSCDASYKCLPNRKLYPVSAPAPEMKTCTGIEVESAGAVLSSLHFACKRHFMGIATSLVVVDASIV